MPNTATFTNLIFLTDFNPADGTYSGGSNTAWTSVIGDDPADTNPANGSSGDGVEYEGEELFWTRNGAVWDYTGYTIDGAPVLHMLSVDTDLYQVPTNSTASLGPGIATSTPEWTYCFARHTLIATPEGERPVESLNIGDPVVTSEGKTVPVKWIGRQTRHPLFAKMSGRLPVLIKAGALGDGLPLRDLYVSPDHAMLVDGVLVHALALVNGVSIVQTQDWREANVEYFHIELENHDLILAEGAPAETFVDNVSRKNFDNYDEYLALWGEGSPVPELSLPRVKNKRQLSSHTRKRLMRIALESMNRVA